MPEANDGANGEKTRVRNRALRLLEEMRGEHERASEDVLRRFESLEHRHDVHKEALDSHSTTLEEHDQNLAQIRAEIIVVLGRLEQVTPSPTESDPAGSGTAARCKTFRTGNSNTKEKAMSDTANENNPQSQLEDWRAISWSSIIFGAMGALAVSVMLHVLGLGVGASSVDTSARPSDAMTLIGGVTGIWFLCSTAISLFIGGFIASTLAHTFTGKRAVVYGFGVWALSTLITMSVLVPALVRGASSAINTAGTVVDRAGAMISSVASGAAQAGQNAPAGLVDSLQRTLIGTPTGQADQGAIQDITRLLGQRFVQGDWSSQQRDQLVNDVARVANISPDDARRRVDEVQNTVNATLEQAQQRLRQAAEATRQAIATAAYSAFAAMLIGLLAALFGARFGELDEDQLPAFARIRFRHGDFPEGQMRR